MVKKRCPNGETIHPPVDLEKPIKNMPWLWVCPKCKYCFADDLVEPRNRAELAMFYNRKNLVGHAVEVGVLRGEHAKTILDNWLGKKLTLVDKWKFKRGESRKEDAKNKLSHDDRVEFLQSDSVLAANEFEDESLSWVYIDADHSFHGVSGDIMAWFPKVKVGGYISGHDYRPDMRYKDGEYGVKSAVDSFAKMLKSEVGLTNEGIQSSWYIFKS